MITTHRRPGICVTALLAGTFTLAACGGQPPDGEALATVSPADLAEDLRKRTLQDREAVQDLDAVADVDPTYPVEVPPPGLTPGDRSRAGAADTGQPQGGQPPAQARPYWLFAQHAE